MPMNAHDLKDLQKISETLRYHYGSTMWMRHPRGSTDFNIVTLLEKIVVDQRRDLDNNQESHAPRRRHVEATISQSKGVGIVPNQREK